MLEGGRNTSTGARSQYCPRHISAWCIAVTENHSREISPQKRGVFSRISESTYQINHSFEYGLSLKPVAFVLACSMHGFGARNETEDVTTSFAEFCDINNQHLY